MSVGKQQTNKQTANKKIENQWGENFKPQIQANYFAVFDSR